MFAAQFFPVLWLAIVQIATYNFLRGNIAGICTPDQAQGLTCPNAKTFFNASVIWGVIVSCPTSVQLPEGSPIPEASPTSAMD